MHLSARPRNDSEAQPPRAQARLSSRTGVRPTPSRLPESQSPSALTSDRLRAHHALLLSQARRKEKLPLNQDSLISDAYKYYSNSSDAKHLMKAAFYLNQADQENGDIDNAFRHAINAYDIAEELNDPLWIARTAEQRALLAHSRFYHSEVEVYSKIAALNYRQAGMVINSQYSLIDLAEAYSVQNKYKEAELLLDSIISNPADSTLLAGALSSAIYNILFTGDIRKASAYMTRLEELNKYYIFSDDDYISKAIIEINLNRTPIPYLKEASKDLGFILQQIHTLCLSKPER